MIKKLAIVSLILGMLFVLPKITEAAGASLYLSPDSGTFFVGSTFDVSIFVNTGGEDVNAVQVDIKFDPSKLQVASPTTGKSFILVWLAQPTYSNTQGTMSFIGGVPTPGIKTSAGLVSTVTFRAVSPGETSVLFLVSSKVLRNDPKGTDILTSKGRGVYNLEIPPPEGPEVYSLTHPDQNKWYKNNNPTFSWFSWEEGVTDFSYSFDQDSAGVSDNESEGNLTSVSFSEVEDGIWYFHVKAKKEEIWGGTSHYSVKIDATPPAAFTPTVEPSPNTTEREPLISFITTDALSGLDYYQLKYIDLTPERKEEETGFFTEVTSPHKLPYLEIGKYLVIVRAYDVAGNWREGTVKIQISSPGIQFRGIIIPWWILFLILLIIIILILFYFLNKYRKLVEREKGELGETEKKLEDEKERIIIEKIRRETREKEIERQKEIQKKMSSEKF